MDRLYTLHSRALAAVHADLENHALAQGEAPLATPGGVVKRRNAGGFSYYALQQYDFEKRRRETYLAGPEGDPDAERKAGAALDRIRDSQEAIQSLRLLSREGYGLMSPRAYAVVASLSNQGLFAGGGLLVGTHAFEAIVNKLGIRAASFATEDVDIGRASKIALPNVPEGGLLEMLRASGVDFGTVPPLVHRDPSIRFKEIGRSRFTVDLIVPSPETGYGTAYVPELKCHAVALPYFRYLVSESQSATVLSRLGCAAVRVPLPERFALHKLLVSQLRPGRSEKGAKDRRQAAILIAALGELEPGALESAAARIPISVRSKVAAAWNSIRETLANHPAGVEQMERALARAGSRGAAG